MTTSTSDTSESTNGPLALLDLEIPGHTGPISSGELGINIAAAIENFKLGLQVFIPPWSSMAPGDSVQVLLDGDVVVSDSIDELEVGERRVLFIESARLTPGATTLAYKVTRFGQQPEPSDDIPVYVKLERPGGQDQNGDTPGHSELHLEIPSEYIENGVDKDQAAAGVPVTIKPYPNMAEHDEIRLSWGGQFVTHTVLKGEVGSDIVKTVDQATILAAGDSGPQGLAVTFDVYDMVENHSEDWSAEIRLVVDTDSTRLGALIVREAQSNVLDLDALGDKPVTASILTPSDDVFEINDEIVVTVKGTTTEGVPVNISCDARTIEDLDDIVDVLVPNTSIRALAKTQAIFSYRLIKKDGSSDLLSKGRFISVIGEVQRLAAPIAKDASQGSIDPELQRTTVEILWDDAMQAGQVIDLKWLGVRPDLSTYFPALDPHLISSNEAVAKQSIFIGVGGVHLAKISGGTLELYYELLSDVKTRTLVTRQSLHAAVLRVGEPRAELPVPTVLYLQDGALDPEDMPPEGTRLIVPVYNGMIAGDEVHYEWKGSITGETATDWIKLNSITDKKPVPFDIRKQLVVDNLGGTVEASYYVVRADGRTSVSDVLTLSIGFEDFTDFNDSARNGWADGAATDPRDWTIVNGPNGSKVLYNHTFSNNSAGVVLQKSVSGLKSGRTYRFEMDAIRSGQGTYPPRLSLATSQGAVSGELTLSSHWTTLAGTFVANASTVECQLISHEMSGAGNDYYVDNIRISAVGDDPFFTSVTDSQGELANGVHTYDTSVTLKGKAAANQKVQILDGTVPKGDVAVNASGDWTLQLIGLSEANYNITARALYGSNAVSGARTFTVTVVNAPTISNLTDSKGVEVPHGSTTFDTAVTLTGKAEANQKVQVLDGTASKGEVTVNASGDWTLQLTGLSVASHSITAKGLYGNNPVSPVRAFSVATATAPTITNVTDSKGEVANNGTTFDTTVTLKGKAGAGQKVQVLDGTTSKGEVAVNASGDWTLQLTGLSVASHSITAKGLYGSNPVSTARTFSVASATAPTITNVTDSKGEVANNGTTFDTTVTLKGKAAANQKVQILDGTTSKGEATVNASGDWTLQLTGLSMASYSIRVKGLYGSNPVSTARTFIIKHATHPTIAYIKDADGNSIPVGGTATSSWVRVYGYAAENVNPAIEVYDGATMVESRGTNPDGSWMVVLYDLSLGKHTVTVKAVYGDKPVSWPFVFYVK
jgi:hypothetical protein